ncbi:Histidine kinase family [Verrucomicrobiia bacterium DG1235]|nr:Histidine kinase family [Verrucomicrobiae bacterium DG1235]
MPVPSPKKLFLWLNINPKWAWAAVAVFTTIGLLNFSAAYSFNQSYGLGIDIPARLFDELTGTWSLLVPLPFLLKWFELYPLSKSNWTRRLPIYLAAMIAMGLLHTTIMTVVRNLAYPVLGFGTYDPGELLYRYVMETAKVSPSFWFFYIGHLLYLKNREKQKEALQLASLQGELAEAKLGSLKNQLNPHFLFNTLNMISSVMYEDIKKADSLLADLSEFLRYNLAFDQVQKVTLKQELAITQKYIDIMASRFDQKLSIKLDIDPELLQKEIPVFCLQPLVENAVKYTMDASDTGEIAIQISQVDSSIRVSVSDNGPGLTAKSQGTQLGLQNIRQRLETLYRGAASLDLQDRPEGGAIAVLEIPLHAA